MSLPLPWVERIFEKLTLLYGQAFLARWRDIDIASVKTDWSHELAGFEKWPEAIAFALQNLPSDKPPTVLQFRDLCRKAPAREAPALPAPRPDTERVQREIGRLRESFNPSPYAVTVDHKAWAKRIIARHDAGEKINRTVLQMARDALRLQPAQACAAA